MQTQTLATWADVTLLFMAAGQDEAVVGERADLFFVFADRGDRPEVWPASTVLENLRRNANLRYDRAARAARASLVHRRRLGDWIAQTRSVVEDLRLVVGDTLAEQLATAASGAEQTEAWLDSVIENPPSDPRQRADLFVTICLWTFDRVRAACLAAAPGATRGLPGKDAGRTAWLRPALEADGQTTRRGAAARRVGRVTGDEGFKMRVRRLRVKPGAEDRLVADVLAACRPSAS